MRGFTYDQDKRIASSWNVTKLLRRGPLSDRRIAFYANHGWYSADFRKARRELMERKRAKRLKREGNFLNEGGRLIYAPL